MHEIMIKILELVFLGPKEFIYFKKIRKISSINLEEEQEDTVWIVTYDGVLDF